ncbi:hypothetical protein C5L30_001985 [Companilactobacillus farciminis]|jgi:DNA polymerase-3 subunit epsilon|uniref:DNA polymerase III polC-type n=1 Tax=Companilactobacillus farciminis TaxID=1612 RepID=A0A4R5NCJ3_9LACO|nr:exonuclease domain-containing protein [Companilactobacillus farciminis]ATO45500.1 DNA polymerase III subunit epsilon [Companilactobacillus farciminis KCTC 3681 = DSM 20184]KRK61272.1 DNA polymerase III [Companilactobacillus farciminis KCTC 3681 = DSM 20184]TDG69852.1 hypothetical protein C5L30_001985 [Companilactobacillus farciminis]
MKIIVGSYFLDIDKGKKKKIEREKGKSRLFFPKDYTLLDFETTGYDPRWDRIIDIGALKVKDNNVVDKIDNLVKYEDDNTVPAMVEGMTGITSEMIEKDGVTAEIAMRNLVDFIDNDVIVGFNVNFDINFLYDFANKYFGQKVKNDFVDVLRIARKFYPEERHNRLADCIKRIEPKKEQSHRGLDDCYDTKLIFDFFEENIDLNLLNEKRHYHHNKIDLKQLKPESVMIDEDNPFYGCNVCFTGKLDGLLRKQAAQLVVNLGGIAQNGITLKTDYLILGDTAYSLHNKGTMTTKMKKAYDLIGKGSNLKVINESVFLDMLNDRQNEIEG